MPLTRNRFFVGKLYTLVRGLPRLLRNALKNKYLVIMARNLLSQLVRQRGGWNDYDNNWNDYDNKKISAVFDIDARDDITSRCWSGPGVRVQL